MFDVSYLYPALVLALGYFVLGLTGFGSALVVVPLLAGIWALPDVVAMAILLDIPASMLHVGLNLKQVRWKEMRRLLPGMAIGTLAGLLLLGVLDRRWPLFILGLYVAFVGIRALVPLSKPSARPSALWAHPVGALIGVIEVMFATAGPVVLAWLHRRQIDVAGIRATVPVIMLLAGLIAVVVLWSSGQINADVVAIRWLYGIPVALLGVVLGNRCAAWVSPLLMTRALAVLLTISGLFLMRHLFV